MLARDHDSGQLARFDFCIVQIAFPLEIVISLKAHPHFGGVTVLPAEAHAVIPTESVRR